MNHSTPRLLRAVVAAAAVTGLWLAVAAPAQAASTPETPTAPISTADLPAGIGAPRLVLLESVHAPGKALQLGDAGAQISSAPGSTEPAAAAIATMKTADPATLQAQALRFYPVTGATNTYVIADQQDRVLARTGNDQSAFRYLRLADLAASATDTYAQWEARDAGDGAVNLVNVQQDTASQPAALDLYNWKTADGSEVQTYTLNASAAVQRWRMRSLAPAVETPTAVVPLGQAPAMPTGLIARYDWGLSFPLTALAWQQPDASVWNTSGELDVLGTARGYFGEEVAVSAHFAVGVAGDAEDAVLSTYAGVTIKELRMTAPATVVRRVGATSATVTSAVTWDWARVTDADFAQVGEVIVPAAGSAGFAARLVVTVNASQQVNILREGGVHPDYLVKDSTTFALTDGKRDVTGFADWRSGGAANRVNPNRVSFVFDQPRQITGAKVFDIGGRKNIGAVTVQYRTLLGGWKDLPTAQGWPVTNSADDLTLEVSSSPVLATAVRAIITNKSSSTWMTLSEVEVYGPRPAAS